METQTMSENLQRLLVATSALVVKNAEISKLRQEKFNIFSILRKEHDEEKLHSAFLAELLSSDGAHEQGNVFCKLLVEQLKVQNFELTEKIVVTKEKYLGALGRMDIHIENEKGQIIGIENKIYAYDQPKQLARYHSYLAGCRAETTLIYLTLYGNEASESSTGTEPIEYTKVSYRDGILNWLDECLKVAVGYPTLRETIRQYSTLVKKLTNRFSTEMEKEMIDLISKNYEAARTIHENIGKAEEAMTVDFLEKIKAELDKLLPTVDDGFKIEINLETGTKWVHGIVVSNPTKWPWETKLAFVGHPFIGSTASVIGFTSVEDHSLFQNKMQDDMNALAKKSGFDEFKNSDVWAYHHFLFESADERRKIFTDKECHKKIVGMFEEIVKRCHPKLQKIKDGL